MSKQQIKTKREKTKQKQNKKQTKTKNGKKQIKSNTTTTMSEQIQNLIEIRGKTNQFISMYQPANKNVDIKYIFGITTPIFPFRHSS